MYTCTSVPNTQRINENVMYHILHCLDLDKLRNLKICDHSNIPHKKVPMSKTV